jgi:hypothetical protein
MYGTEGCRESKRSPRHSKQGLRTKVSRRDEGGDIWSDELWVLSPNEFSAPQRAPEVLFVSQVQAAIIVMSGILIIPLWKKAKFWTFVFQGRDSFECHV